MELSLASDGVFESQANFERTIVERRARFGITKYQELRRKKKIAQYCFPASQLPKQLREAASSDLICISLPAYCHTWFGRSPSVFTCPRISLTHRLSCHLLKPLPMLVVHHALSRIYIFCQVAQFENGGKSISGAVDYSRANLVCFVVGNHRTVLMQKAPLR